MDRCRKGRSTRAQTGLRTCVRACTHNIRAGSQPARNWPNICRKTAHFTEIPAFLGALQVCSMLAAPWAYSNGNGNENPEGRGDSIYANGCDTHVAALQPLTWKIVKRKKSPAARLRSSSSKTAPPRPPLRHPRFLPCRHRLGQGRSQAATIGCPAATLANLAPCRGPATSRWQRMICRNTADFRGKRTEWMGGSVEVEQGG